MRAILLLMAMVTVGDASTSSPLSSAVISPGSLPAEISLNWEDLEATYAADKSFEAAYARAATTIGAWRKVCNRGLEIQNFGTLASELMDECLGLFSGEHVAVEKRKGELKSFLKSEITATYRSQVKTTTTSIVKKFDARLLQLLDGAKDSAVMPEEKVSKEVRASSAAFAAAIAKLVVPGVVGSEGGLKESETFGELLSQKAADFEDTPAAKVLKFNKLQRKSQRSKKLPKNPRSIVPGLHLVAMMRQVGIGNLNGFAGYNFGPHSITCGYENNRGPPESGDDSALLRLQPKIHFDVE